jgi:AbrB family looped-hinge helix DNA binding protein
MDASGRVVIPKVLREALGLNPGRVVEITVRDRLLEIAAVEESGQRALDDAPMDSPGEETPTLTVDMVRETLDRIRR